jgi:hypothetical protein
MNFECYSYMSYIYTRKHHKEDSSVWGEFQEESGGATPRDSSVRGSDEEVTFSIDVKGGEIYQMHG